MSFSLDIPLTPLPGNAFANQDTKMPLQTCRRLVPFSRRFHQPCFSTCSSFSQTLTLSAFYSDSTPVEITYRKSHSSYESVSEESTRIVKVLHSAGYLTAHIQSITQIDSLNWNAILIKGKPLIIGQLSFAEDDRIWLENAGLMRWQNKDTYYRHDQMVIFYAKILSWLENNGFPFARIRLDKVETDA
jgi:hypothetical protein